MLPGILAFCIISGCGEIRLDSSSDDNMKASIENITQSLPVEKQDKFKEAIRILAFADIKGILDPSFNPDETKKKLMARLNNKTAEEIISEADKILSERKQKEADQANIEIDELKIKIKEIEQKRNRKASDKKELEKFQVIKSRFSFEKIGFMKSATINLDVKNNTSYPISRVYFHGILSSPGRSIPWVKNSFNYNIPGGLEPGENASWSLSFSFGEWSAAPEERNDLILTVSTIRIDGPDDKPIFSTETSDEDNEQLSEYQKRLKALEDGIGK